MDISRSYVLLLRTAVVFGVLGIAAALTWLLVPQTSPFVQMATPPPLVLLVGATPMHAAQLVTALLATVTATAPLRRRDIPRRQLLSTAAVVTVVFGLGSGSMGTLAHTGYLLALVTPVVLLAGAIAGVSRGGLARWALGIPLFAAILGGAWFGRQVLGELLGSLLPALADQSLPITSTLLFVGLGSLWLGIAVTTARGTDLARRSIQWLLRHRRGLTILAACGPLPYALARLTWLTPWPMFGGDLAAADPTVLVWGLALSLGCWLGVVLTLGLISPWGEVFPGWFPRIGGRSVPIAVAAVPGFTTAALLCFAALPVAWAGVQQDPVTAWAFLLVFPCWFWGPALALSVGGYVAHRKEKAEQSRPHAVSSAKMRGWGRG